MRHSRHWWPINCSLNPYVVIEKTITARLFYLKQFSLYQKMFCPSVFCQCYFSHKCRTCPKSPILDKPRLVIGSGQSLWSRHVNLFLSNVLVYQLFVFSSVKHKKFIKQCLGGIVCQLPRSFEFCCFRLGKKSFYKNIFEKVRKSQFFAFV